MKTGREKVVSEVSASPDKDRGLRLRQGFSLTLLLGGLLVAVGSYASDVAAGGNKWQTADWLINYGGGFVRRGLFGELIFGLGLSPAWTLWLSFVVQTCCYLLVGAYFVDFLRRQRYSWWAIALACNPAALMFVGYAPGSSYRKEILVFATLTLLAIALRGRGLANRIRHALTLGGLVIYGLAVYSWECAAFALPMVIYLIVNIHAVMATSRLAVWSTIVAAAALAVSGFALSVLASGNESQVVDIVAGLKAHGFANDVLLNGGAIDALGWTNRHALSVVGASFPLHLWFLPLAILASLPLASTAWIRENWRWALAIILGILPLFFVGVDYGRWIHMLILGLTVCVMAVTERVSSPRWNPLIALLFVVSWGVPNLIRGYYDLWRGLGHTLYLALKHFV